nr:immunoglobulin light chain junction region [Macaca mulatta]
CQQHDDFPRTF